MPPSPRSRISCRRRRMRPSGSPIDGGILRPNGRAAPRPAPFARPRPPKACSPLRSSVLLCLSGASAGRDAAVHHVPSPYYLRDGQEEASASALVLLPFRFRSTLASLTLRARSAPLRLPAAPAGSSKLSPASAATARRTPSATLPTFPSRLAGLVGLQRLAVQGRPNPPSRPERPTANGHLPARPRPPGTLALAKFEK